MRCVDWLMIVCDLMHGVYMVIVPHAFSPPPPLTHRTHMVMISDQLDKFFLECVLQSVHDI
jgi:hypothetical protein